MKWTMGKEFKKDWIEALRSGKYKQGECYLASNSWDQENKKNTKIYCCLGVACHISNIPFSMMDEISTPFELFNSFECEEKGYNSSYIINEASVLIEEPLGEDMLTSRLIAMNDGDEGCGIHAHSFDQIANYIEKEVEGI